MVVHRGYLVSLFQFMPFHGKIQNDQVTGDNNPIGVMWAENIGEVAEEQRDDGSS